MPSDPAPAPVATATSPAVPVAQAPPAPKPDPALTPEQRRAYLAALDAGRKAHRAKDYPAAVAQFDAALALQPDDPRALAERGWARFQAGQLPEAEADTRAALARTTDLNLLGSAGYNLGRVLEAQGRTEDAVAAYRASLGFRPNATVSRRLAGLPGGAGDAWTATPMAGPYATLDAWCDERRAAAREERGPDAKPALCDPAGKDLGEYEGPHSLDAGSTNVAPFEEVRVLAVGHPTWGDTMDGATEVAYTLAVRTAAGWYTRDVVAAYNPGAFGIFEGVKGEALAVEHGRLVFAYTHNRHDSDLGLNELQTDDDSWLLVCGVGAAGPSCLDAVVTASLSERALLVEEEEPDPTITHTLFHTEWKGAARVTEAGALEVTGPENPLLPGHVGTHRLTFP